MMRCWPPAGNGQPCEWASSASRNPNAPLPAVDGASPECCSGSRQPRCRPRRPVEHVKAERLDRSDQPPREHECVPAQADRQCDGRPDRRQGAQDGVDETLSERTKLLDQLPPRSPRSPKRPVQRRDCRPKLVVQHDRAAVLERVSHDLLGPDPPKTFGLELELADRRRRNRHWVEPSAVIVHEPGESGLDARRRPTRTRRMLHHRDLQPRAGQVDGAHQPRRAGANDHHTPITHHGRSPKAPSCPTHSPLVSRAEPRSATDGLATMTLGARLPGAPGPR